MTLAYDYALVGGGLQNGLLALALTARQPGARIALLERSGSIGGNHTWSFHAGDLPEGAHAWIEPAVAARWSSYEVAFPGMRRVLSEPYASVSSTRLAEKVSEALDRPGCTLALGTKVETVEAQRVVGRSPDGSPIEVTAEVVIDARGPDRYPSSDCGWQKFVGQELVLARPHGLERPVMMDATLPQRDGFRFMYVLPLAPDRVLVEDTYFSDSSHLDVAALRAEVAAYVEARGWQTVEVAREESGVLPMPWKLRAPVARPPLVGGYAGGWFHPVTGYSFPIAARLADLIASLPPGRLFGPELAAFTAAHTRQLGFARSLSFMLFRWFPPAERHHVLARFYRLPPASIRRFYALQMTVGDRARIFAGRPPRGISWRAVFGGEAR